MLQSILSHLDRKDHAQARHDLGQVALELRRLRETVASALSRADAVPWGRLHPAHSREIRAIFDLLRGGGPDVAGEVAA